MIIQLRHVNRLRFIVLFVPPTIISFCSLKSNQIDSRSTVGCQARLIEITRYVKDWFVFEPDAAINQRKMYTELYLES